MTRCCEGVLVNHRVESKGGNETMKRSSQNVCGRGIFSWLDIRVRAMSTYTRKHQRPLTMKHRYRTLEWIGDIKTLQIFKFPSHGYNRSEVAKVYFEAVTFPNTEAREASLGGKRRSRTPETHEAGAFLLCLWEQPPRFPLHPWAPSSIRSGRRLTQDSPPTTSARALHLFLSSQPCWNAPAITGLASCTS